MNEIGQVIAFTFRSQINKRTLLCFTNSSQRCAHSLLTAPFTRRTRRRENIAKNISAMHANQDWIFVRTWPTITFENSNSAKTERQMRLRVERTMPSIKSEWTFGSFHKNSADRCDSFDKSFAAQTMFDDLLYRTNLERMFFAQSFQIVHACHLAIFANDFDDARRRKQSSQATEIDRSFGLSCSH